MSFQPLNEVERHRLDVLTAIYKAWGKRKSGTCGTCGRLRRHRYVENTETGTRSDSVRTCELLLIGRDLFDPPPPEWRDEYQSCGRYQRRAK